MLLPLHEKDGDMNDSTARSSLAGSMRQAFLWALLPTLVLCLVAPSVGDAQQAVTTNITSTTSAGNLGTTITHTGNLYDITGGTRPGNGPNLFHSFGDFSVGGGDIANFLNNTQLPTSNILGRVTGGASNIDGMVQTTGFGNANLFLVNPSGIVFGPNGSVNVGGSVSFSAAQYLRFFDGVNSANFYANPANDGLANSVLAVAPVVDFGFLSPAAYGFLTAPDPSVTITVQGSLISVTSDQSISLVGGKVVIEGGAQLLAPNGRIHLGSAASPGEFAAPPGEFLSNATALQSVPNNPVDQASTASFSSFGTVSLAPSSSVDVHGTSTVWIKGGQLVLSVNDATLNTSLNQAQSDTISLSQGSSILISNTGADPGPDLQLTASNVQLDGASIQSVTTGDGRGGHISILDTQSVSLTNGAQIVSDTKGGGDGGKITIASANTLDSSVMVSGFDSEGTLSGVVNPLVGVLTSGVFSIASAGGNGGQISLRVPHVTLDNQGIIASLNSGDGDGGNISINATTIGFTNGGSVWSSTGFDFTSGLLAGLGNGGSVTIQGLSETTNSEANSVTVSGGEGITTGITTLTSGPGHGGAVQLIAGNLTMENSASIVTLALAGGGVGGDVVLNVETASLLGGSSIQSQTQNFTPESGQGGNVTIHGLPGVEFGAARSVILSDGSFLLSEAQGSSDGGRVTVTSKSLTMEGAGTTIHTQANDVGRGGDIVVSVRHAKLSDGATITTQTVSGALNAQPGPTLTVQGLQGAGSKADSFVLSGFGSGIVSDSSGTARAGDVALQAKTVSLADGAVIQAGTPSTTAAGGNVTIQADSVDISGGSRISSQASHSDAGQVTITASTFTLNNGSITTQSVSEGRGGDVGLNVGSVSLSNGGTINSSSTGTGNAGNITITSASNVIMQNSSITTASDLSSGGQITIKAPELIHLINSNIITSVAGSSTDTFGGNITIDPQFVVLQNSQILARANAGSGGAIDIIAGSAFIADPLSIVDASSTLGISGTVNIQSPLQNVGGELTALSQEFSSAAALLAQQCAARAAGGTFSTFVVAAREGLPVEPGGFLASPSLTAELLGPRLSGRGRQTQLSAVTGLFPQYNARPIQLAKFGGACH